MREVVELLLLGAVVICSNALSSVANIYWLNAPLSLWGNLVFTVAALTVFCSLVLTAVARWHAIPLSTAFRIDNDPAQCQLFSRFGGRMTTMQTMAAISCLNSVAALTSWYATPPSRTPPIIQSVFNSLIVIAAAPASRLLLRDNKRYCSREPAVAVCLLLLAVGVSLYPAASAQNAGAQFSGSGAGLWSVVYAFLSIPQALAIVCGQLFQVKAGALRAGATVEIKRLIICRMVFYNQLFVMVMLCIFWWVDILPWFGSSASASVFAAGVRFTFECSLLGPGGVTGGGGAGTHSAAFLLLSGGGVSAAPLSCPALTQLWVFLFLSSYVVLLVAQAAISRESAVFNTAVLLLSGSAVSLFFLIPGVNPDAANTPTLSVLTALALSLAGVVIWKRWELRTPAAAQFGVKSIAEELEADAAGAAAAAAGSASTQGADATASPPEPTASTRLLLDTRSS